MKFVWALFALLLACLAIGGLSAGLSGRNGGGVFDLLIAAGLAWAAWGVWKRGVLAGRDTQPKDTDEPDRPWRR